jgi:hypothetical protein
MTTPMTGISLGGVALPDLTVIRARSIAEAPREQRTLIEQGDGSLHVVSRWAGTEYQISAEGWQMPAGLRTLSRTALVSLIYPDMAASGAARTVSGIITDGPTVQTDPKGVTVGWSVTLRACTLATTGALSIGGVAVPIEARVGGVSITRERAPGGWTPIQMADGTVVPQHFWTRYRYRISGQGWAPPGLASLAVTDTISLVSVPWGTVSCWIVEALSQTWTHQPDGPGWSWALTLQAQAA